MSGTIHVVYIDSAPVSTVLTLTAAPRNTMHSAIARLMLVQRRRRWTNINPALVERM